VKRSATASNSQSTKASDPGEEDGGGIDGDGGDGDLEEEEKDAVGFVRGG